MAEPLGIAASLITIGVLASSATKFARELYKATADTGSPDSAVRRTASYLSTFRSAVGLAKTQLHDVCESCSPQSGVIRYIEKGDLASNLDETSKLVDYRIDRMRRHLRSVLSGPPLWATAKRVLWMLTNKSELLTLIPEMESIKTTLILIFACVQMDLTVKNSDGPRALEKIAELKEVIRDQIRIMKRLREDLLEIRKRSAAARPGSHIYVETLMINSIEPLLELGKSVRDRGTVPGAPEESTHTARSSEMLSSDRPTTGRTSPVTPSENLVTRSTSLTSQASYRSNRSNRSNRPTRYAGGWSSGSGSWRPTNPEIEVPAPLEVRRSVAIPPSSAVRPHDSDYMDVRPRNLLIQLRNSPGSFSCYIKSLKMSAPWPVNARVDELLEENLISLKMATDRRLEIRPTDEEDKLSVRFRDGRRQPAIGRLQLGFCKNIGTNAPRFSLHLWVVPDLPEDMILGRPFLNKKAHYWPEGKGPVDNSI